MTPQTETLTATSAFTMVLWRQNPALHLLRHSDGAAQFMSRNHDALEKYVANKWPLFKTEDLQ